MVNRKVTAAAAKRKATSKQKTKAERQAAQTLDVKKLFATLRRERPLPKDFSELVDRKLKYDDNRRIALAFLSKPFKEMEATILKDRQTAVVFAAVAECFDDSIRMYQDLADLLEKAQLRIHLALCEWPDMEEIVTEAKKSVIGNWPLEKYAAAIESGSMSVDSLVSHTKH